MECQCFSFHPRISLEKSRIIKKPPKFIYWSNLQDDHGTGTGGLDEQVAGVSGGSDEQEAGVSGGSDEQVAGVSDNVCIHM